MTDLVSFDLPIKLSDGTIIFANVQQTDREEEVSLKEYSFSDALNSLKSLANDIVTPLMEYSCDKVVLELNVGLAVKSGKLTSLLVNGSGSSSIKLKMEFNRPTSSD